MRLHTLFLLFIPFCCFTRLAAFVVEIDPDREALRLAAYIEIIKTHGPQIGDTITIVETEEFLGELRSLLKLERKIPTLKASKSKNPQERNILTCEITEYNPPNAKVMLSWGNLGNGFDGAGIIYSMKNINKSWILFKPVISYEN